MSSGNAGFVETDPSAEAAPTPLDIANRPGLSAISYRIGAHPNFKAAMLARLASSLGQHMRDDSDPTVALIDAFAAMADTLTFYQERIANESYLRTATERRSLVELGRLIDYRPRPGVAASAFLAFTLEDAKGAPENAALPITIDVGLKVLSLPKPGALPQVFETVESIEARPEWNAIAPRATQPQPLSTDMASVLAVGGSVNVNAGDQLLIVADSQAAKLVVNVAADPATGVTRLDLTDNPPDPPPFILPRLPIGRFFTDRRPLTELVVSQSVFGRVWPQHDLEALAAGQYWPLRVLRRHFARRVSDRVFPPDQGVFAFRARAAIFGHNAPKYASLPQSQQGTAFSDWDGGGGRRLGDDSGSSGREIDLDRVYPGLVAGSWVVLQSQTDRKIYRVEEVGEISRADYTLSGKLTRLRLDSNDGFDTFTLRGTSVLLQSEQLALADLPIPDPVAGGDVTLDGAYFGLKIGQTVILTGERADLPGATASEALTLADVVFAEGYTSLSFANALQNSYVRETVTISANVALATHGESVQEILGGGDASQTYLRLALRQAPLTFVSSDAPAGAESTLRVRINGLLWSEVQSFYGRGPNERIFTARTGDDGVTEVAFGDGLAGARPPTGSENIRASYRKGGGAAGNVDAGALSLTPARPMGVRAVTNPLAASGATDAESVDEIRGNAALTMLTLDRIVSLQDYEDFARAFAGVAKALATWTSNGQKRGVFVTVAGAGGAELAPNNPTFVNLLTAMRNAGDSQIPLRVQSYRRAFFRLSGVVTIDPAAPAPTVLATAESALRSAFSFDARAFGQSVGLGEVMATIQTVPGVRAVEIDQFFRTDQLLVDEFLFRSRRHNLRGVPASLAASAPEAGLDGLPAAAELLILDPRPVHLTGVSP